jgi:hypothetical protein
MAMIPRLSPTKYFRLTRFSAETFCPTASAVASLPAFGASTDTVKERDDLFDEGYRLLQGPGSSGLARILVRPSGHLPDVLNPLFLKNLSERNHSRFPLGEIFPSRPVS